MIDRAVFFFFVLLFWLGGTLNVVHRSLAACQQDPLCHHSAVDIVTISALSFVSVPILMGQAAVDLALDTAHRQMNPFLDRIAPETPPTTQNPSEHSDPTSTSPNAGTTPTGEPVQLEPVHDHPTNRQDRFLEELETENDIPGETPTTNTQTD